MWLYNYYFYHPLGLFLCNLTSLCDGYSVISACGLTDSDSRFPVKVNLVKVDALRWNHNQPVSPGSCWLNGYQFTGGELAILNNINILNGFAVLSRDGRSHILTIQTSFPEDAGLSLVSFLHSLKWGQDLLSSATETKFARSNVQSEGSAWFCVRVPDLWTSREGCVGITIRLL